MLYDLRTTARGGVGAREIGARVGTLQGTGGVFSTEVGEAGRLVVIWERNDGVAKAGPGFEGEGRRGRAAGDLFGKNELEILRAAPFMAPLEPQKLGDVWELAWYDFPAGTVTDALPAMEEAVSKRAGLYPVVGCWTVDVGFWEDRIYLLYPYKDWDHRDEITAKLRSDPAWPPRVGAFRAGSKLILPAGFSPLH